VQVSGRNSQALRPNYWMNLTDHASRPLLAVAPPHISSQGGAQGARHVARRLSIRYVDFEKEVTAS
jgi:hypothetical protein